MARQLIIDRSEQDWRLIRIVAILLFSFTSVLIILILTGVFDQKPFGPLLRGDQPGEFSLAGKGGDTFEQPAPWPAGEAPDQFSVHLTAAHTDGELDSGFGLVLAGLTSRLTVAVSPLGYVAVWEEENGGEPFYLMAWQPWPHVRTGTAENEIWVDVDNSTGYAMITAWIDRELLWQGKIRQTKEGAGLWIGSFGGRTSVDFWALDWFAKPDD